MTVELWSFSSALGCDSAELLEMSVEALDGSVGKVTEVVDRIGDAYLIVDTGPWIFGRTVMVPAGVVTGVDRERGCVFIGRAKEDVKHAPAHDAEEAAGDQQREALTAYWGAGPDPESSLPVEPRAHADASAADIQVGGTAVASPGRPDDDQIDSPTTSMFGTVEDADTGTTSSLGPVEKTDTPPASTAGGVDRADAPPTAAFGGSGDADEGRGSESESPTAIGTGSGQPDDRGGEAPRSDVGEASMTPVGEYAEAPGSQPSGAVPGERPAGSPEQPERREDGIAAPAAGSTSSVPAGAPAGVSPSDREETSEDARTATSAAAEGAGRQPTTHRRRSRPAKDRAAQTEETRTRRFARPSQSRSETTPREGGKSRRSGGARKASAELPIARYDSLTAAQVITQLRRLSQRELANVERYEKRHQSRQTVLNRVGSLRENEPWRGYDDATVDEVRKKLANADEHSARAVRDYERRHRDRKGVMEAARRTVASS